MLVTRLLSSTNVCIQKSRRAKPQVVHVDKLKPCRGVTPTSWLDQEPDSSDDDGAVEDPGLPARLAGDLTDGIDGSSLVKLPIGDLKNFPDTGGINVDEHPAMPPGSEFHHPNGNKPNRCLQMQSHQKSWETHAMTRRY